MLLSYLYPDLLEKLKRQDNRMQIYFAVCGFFTNKKYFLPSQNIVVIVQSLSHVWLFATPRSVACQASLSFTISRSLLKFMFIVLVMLFNHLIFCCPLLFLPMFPSMRVFSSESILYIRWPIIFCISPSTEYSGLISFRMDWLDLLAIQGLWRVFSNTTVQKHKFFGAQLSLWSNSPIHTVHD